MLCFHYKCYCVDVTGEISLTAALPADKVCFIGLDWPSIVFGTERSQNGELGIIG